MSHPNYKGKIWKYWNVSMCKYNIGQCIRFTACLNTYTMMYLLSSVFYVTRAPKIKAQR